MLTPDGFANTRSGRNGGLAHGLDNHVALALLELFVEAGHPALGELEVGAYTILEKTGWSRSGHYDDAPAP